MVLVNFEAQVLARPIIVQLSGVSVPSSTSQHKILIHTMQDPNNARFMTRAKGWRNGLMLLLAPLTPPTPGRQIHYQFQVLLLAVKTGGFH